MKKITVERQKSERILKIFSNTDVQKLLFLFPVLYVVYSQLWV